MKRNARPGVKKIRTWKEGRVLLERWRRNLATIEVELKQPRLIDGVPIQFVGGEPVQPERNPSRSFRGQLIYFSSADVSVRRRSGAIVVIDSYEIVAISDGKIRFEPR